MTAGGKPSKLPHQVRHRCIGLCHYGPYESGTKVTSRSLISVTFLGLPLDKHAVRLTATVTLRIRPPKKGYNFRKSYDKINAQNFNNLIRHGTGKNTKYTQPLAGSKGKIKITKPSFTLACSFPILRLPPFGEPQSIKQRPSTSAQATPHAPLLFSSLCLYSGTAGCKGAFATRV